MIYIKELERKRFYQLIKILLKDISLNLTKKMKPKLIKKIQSLMYLIYHKDK